jgi:uncharacterized membrane protein YeiH
MENQLYTIIEIAGTAAFSISGVFAAMEKKLDVLGMFIIAFITAIGGGTLRDVLIGDLPVNWMRSNTNSIVIFVSALVAMFFYNAIKNYDRILLLFDSIGLGFFTILGIQKGIQMGLSPGICVALGTITACFGGLIRDITLNQIPHIFHKEVYATACIAGGILYLVLQGTMLPAGVIDALCISMIVSIRLLAVRYNWKLPVISRSDKKRG